MRKNTNQKKLRTWTLFKQCIHGENSLIMRYIFATVKSMFTLEKIINTKQPNKNYVKDTSLKLGILQFTDAKKMI